MINQHTLPLLAALVTMAACSQPGQDPSIAAPPLAADLVNQVYAPSVSEPTWAEVLGSGALEPLGTDTTRGVTGKKININNDLIEQGPYANNPIDSKARRMQIHTLGHSNIPAQDFHKWSRWYQEDGNTQIFRLFKGEHNVRNTRRNAARIEAFSPADRWMPEPGVWREFGARFTVLKSAGCVGFHHCSIFQAKGNNVDHWSVMLRVDEHANLWFYPRRGFGVGNNQNRKLLSKNILGKPFDVKVRDNGLDYETYIDNQLVGTGQWQRTEEIGFRWGIYVGDSEVANDVMVLVTGVTMK